ncbi:MAG TPA: hypothetical protein VK755_16240 [Candidatus Acidoferrales bacterium]|nr:hypothetical protein [Candidatus Acidoferrales bacterium]
MARNDGNGVSFLTAAKQLFRHLHDPRALRKNPLVGHFFAYAEAGGTRSATDRAALARIHELIKRGADRCREADQLEGRDRRALHHHAIIMQQCLGQRPLSAVAAELGISHKHCYRQRAEVCRRVAQYISQCDDGRLIEYIPDVDAFRIELDQAAHRSAFLDLRSALQQCEALARSAPSATLTIEALRIAATTAMYFGDAQNVNRFYAAARRIYSENLSDPSFGRVVARACIDLIESKAAYYGASIGDTLFYAKRAARALGCIWSVAPERIRELYLESLYDAAAALCITGDLDRSYEHLLEAEAGAKRISVSSARLRARIALAGWKLRTCSLLSSATFRPAFERHRGLLSAFELAYGAGALPEATAAIIALAEHHAIGGDDAQALRTVRFALALAARQHSERLRTQTSIKLALILSFTHHWAFGLSLLPDASVLDRADALHRELADHALAKRALHSRRFEDAWRLASRKSGRGDFTALAVGRQIVAAQAAHRLGRQRNAQALVEAIVPAAERLSDAVILRDAYGVAANVTGETRFKRRARDLAKLIVE